MFFLTCQAGDFRKKIADSRFTAHGKAVFLRQISFFFFQNGREIFCDELIPAVGPDLMFPALHCPDIHGQQHGKCQKIKNFHVLGRKNAFSGQDPFDFFLFQAAEGQFTETGKARIGPAGKDDLQAVKTGEPANLFKERSGVSGGLIETIQKKQCPSPGRPVQKLYQFPAGTLHTVGMGLEFQTLQKPVADIILFLIPVPIQRYIVDNC